MRTKTISVIRTQKELENVMVWEANKYYLVLEGELAVLDEVAPWMSKSDGELYLLRHYKSLPALIKKMEITGYNKAEIETAIKQFCQSYVLPWRYH